MYTRQPWQFISIVQFPGTKKKQDLIKRPFKNNDLFVIGKEDYKELKDCLAKTFEEIEKIKEEGVQVDGEHYDVQWCI